MAYEITDLGAWERYTPDTLPEGAPDGALFARRIGDGMDWYALVHGRRSFPEGAVLATTIPVTREGVAGNMVSAVTRDPSTLFPAGGHLVQITGVPDDEEKPWKLFEGQNYNPEAGTVEPFPEIPAVVVTFKADIWRRCTEDEAEALDSDLAAQTAKIRRQFDDAQHIDHSDALFGMMMAAITARFGEPRAKEILAPSE